MGLTVNLFELEGLCVIFVLLMYLFASMYIPLLKINVGHQTGIAVLLGIFAGYFANTVIVRKMMKQEVKFDENMFFYIVLPPIIFAQGYNMKRRRFFQNFTYIALFGIAGTIINFVFNVLGALYASRQGWTHDQDGKHVKLTDVDVFLLSAVLSASDTVAAVSIIEETDVPKVHSILLGEGVMNDAVSIILFHSAMSLGIYSIEAKDIGMFIGEFLYDMLASITIGIIFGVLSAVITKFLTQFERFPPYETALLFFLAYFGYIITLILGLSGVISILVSGIVMGHYTWYNLSTEGRIVSRAAFQIIGELLEAYVFVYVGFGTYDYYGKSTSIDFIAIMIVVVLLGRFMAIFVVPGIIKLIWRKFDLKWKELVTIWFAGSIRGAIAFALILSVPDDAKNKLFLKTSILGVVLFTTIVFGSVMPLLKKLLITLSKDYVGQSQIVRVPITFEMMSANNDPCLSGDRPKTKIHKKWRTLDDSYLKKWLIKPKGLLDSNQSAVDFHIAFQNPISKSLTLGETIA